MQDLWLALRLVRTRPGFTLAAVIPLAAAIACATAVLTLVDAVLYRPLGVRDPASLAAIYGYSRTKAAYLSDSWPEFRDVSALGGVVESAAAYVRLPVNADLGGGSERVAAEIVSGGYFGTLGVTPVAGRALGPEDDRPDRDARNRRQLPVVEQPVPTKRRGAGGDGADWRYRLFDRGGDAGRLHRHAAGLGRGSAIVDSDGVPGAVGAGLRSDRLPEPARRALGDDDREAQARNPGRRRRRRRWMCSRRSGGRRIPRRTGTTGWWRCHRAGRDFSRRTAMPRCDSCGCWERSRRRCSRSPASTWRTCWRPAWRRAKKRPLPGWRWARAAAGSSVSF